MTDDQGTVTAERSTPDLADRPVKAGRLRRWRAIAVGITAVFDAAMITAANIVTRALDARWHADEIVLTPTFEDSTLFFGSVVIGVGFSLGLYRSMFRTKPADQLRLAAKTLVIGAVSVILIQYFFHMREYDVSYLSFFFASLVCLFIAARLAIMRILQLVQKHGLMVSPGIVLQANSTADTSYREFVNSSRSLGLRLRTFPVFTNNDNVYCNISQRPWMEIANGDCRDVFLVSSPCDPGLIDEAVAWCRKHRANLALLSNDVESLLSSLGIRDITGIPLVTHPPKLPLAINDGLKRTLDILLALTMIIICLPFFLVIAAAILIADGRPVIYRQRRALVPGKNEFWMYKFRSMKQGTDALHPELCKANLTSPGLLYLTHDPRITAVGRVIRKLSLDELPQLFNVLKGDMSMVGPRPLMLADLAQASPGVISHGLLALRTNVSPGMTGLWQTCGRREVPFTQMLLLDLYYAHRRSFFLDIHIITRTILVVLLGKGAH